MKEEASKNHILMERMLDVAKYLSVPLKLISDALLKVKKSLNMF